MLETISPKEPPKDIPVAAAGSVGALVLALALVPSLPVFLALMPAAVVPSAALASTAPALPRRRARDRLGGAANSLAEAEAEADAEADAAADDEAEAAVLVRCLALNIVRVLSAML